MAVVEAEAGPTEAVLVMASGEAPAGSVLVALVVSAGVTAAVSPTLVVG